MKKKKGYFCPGCKYYDEYTFGPYEVHLDIFDECLHPKNEREMLGISHLGATSEMINPKCCDINSKGTCRLFELKPKKISLWRRLVIAFSDKPLDPQDL